MHKLRSYWCTLFFQRCATCGNTTTILRPTLFLVDHHLLRLSLSPTSFGSGGYASGVSILLATILRVFMVVPSHQMHMGREEDIHLWGGSAGWYFRAYTLVSVLCGKWCALLVLCYWGRRFATSGIVVSLLTSAVSDP